MWDFDLPSPWHALHPAFSSLPIKLVAELIILIPQPLPSFQSNIFGFSNDHVVYMGCRVYTVVRLIHDYGSPFRVLLTTGAQKNRRINLAQTLKLLLNRNVMLCVTVILPFMTLAGAYSVHIFERGYFISAMSDANVPPIFAATLPPNVLPDLAKAYAPSPFGFIGNSCWYCIETISTLGYGDLVPISKSGRFMSSVLVLFGVLVTSFFVGALSVALEPTPQESDILEFVREHDALSKLKKAAAELIVTVVRRHLRLNKTRKVMVSFPLAVHYVLRDVRQRKGLKQKPTLLHAPSIKSINRQIRSVSTVTRESSVDMNVPAAATSEFVRLDDAGQPVPGGHESLIDAPIRILLRKFTAARLYGRFVFV